MVKYWSLDFLLSDAGQPFCLFDKTGGLKAAIPLREHDVTFVPFLHVLPFSFVALPKAVGSKLISWESFGFLFDYLRIPVGILTGQCQTGYAWPNKLQSSPLEWLVLKSLLQ